MDDFDWFVEDILIILILKKIFKKKDIEKLLIRVNLYLLNGMIIVDFGKSDSVWRNFKYSVFLE